MILFVFIAVLATNSLHTEGISQFPRQPWHADDG